MNNDRINQRSTAFRRLCLGATLIASAVSAHAHPGHGLLDEGPLHTVTSPYHLAVLALFGIALFASAHLTKQVMPRRAMQSLGVIALALSAVLWGLRI
jgi:hypothetical protein